MKTIVVPTDLSPLAHEALQVAADLARTYKAEITLVHYLPFSIARASTVEGSMMMVDYLGERENVAQASLQSIIDDPAYKDITLHPIVCDDADGLYDAVTKRGADLIVLATHGTSGWDEWLFGSNAEHIVRQAHCPVLVIKKGIVPFAPVNPLAAIDLDDTLMQQWPSYPFPASAPLKQFMYVSTPTDVHVAEGVQAWMNELALKNGIVDFNLHICHARSVENGVLNYANECGADLIVVYTHGHTGLLHFLQGSFAEDILNHAELPVLILPLTVEDTTK